MIVTCFGENVDVNEELHVEVSLSKILSPKAAPDVLLAPCVAATAICKGPAMSWIWLL